jgi:hypothetical protein
VFCVIRRPSRCFCESLQTCLGTRAMERGPEASLAIGQHRRIVPRRGLRVHPSHSVLVYSRLLHLTRQDASFTGVRGRRRQQLLSVHWLKENMQ